MNIVRLKSIIKEEMQHILFEKYMNMSYSEFASSLDYEDDLDNSNNKQNKYILVDLLYEIKDVLSYIPNDNDKFAIFSKCVEQRLNEKFVNDYNIEKDIKSYLKKSKSKFENFLSLILKDYYNASAQKGLFSKKRSILDMCKFLFSILHYELQDSIEEYKQQNLDKKISAFKLPYR